MSPSGVPTGEIDTPGVDPAGSWIRQAACTGCPASLWFPARWDAASRNQAIAICQTCPVRCDCLDYAMRQRIDHGIWGGLSEKARLRLRRGLPIPRGPAPEHGHQSRYNYYRCRCDDCRESHRAGMADYRARPR